MAQYGAYTYESTESRALKSIRNDSYNKDMAKNLIQLNHNTEYMAQYMRKLQKGVDEAGANTIEQVQNFVADMLVLFGGGSMTAIDFGDLKYIFQAIGALFGFTNPDGSVKIPPNLIEAAWNFFSSYILPNGDFTEVINIIIDGAIGVVLDLFGEVPIIGEGVQQLAMVLSELRDMLLLVFDAINSVMNAFSIDMEDLGGITSFFTNLFSFLGDINFASPSFNLIEAASEFITNILIPTNLFPDIIEMAKNFLTHESPLNVLNLFGQIRPDQLGNIPISHLGVYKAELLINPKFNGAVSTSGQDVWFWNEDEGHDSPGSAWTDAESVEKELLSNYIPVSEGQTAHGKAWAKWSALVGSGILIRLDFALFNEVSQDVLVPVGTMQLDSISDPTTNANWTKLEGSLTIPENVTHVRLRLVVTNAATSGRVYWDDGSVWKSGLLAQWLVENLIPDLDSITNHIRSFIESALDVFGLVPSGELLEDIFSLSDEFSWLIDLANEGVGKATTALNNVGTLATKLLTNPVEALGEIPQVLVAGLSGTLSEFYQVRDILRGYVVTPINSAVQDIKDWWSSLGGKLQNLTTSGTIASSAVTSDIDGAASIEAALQSVIDGAIQGAGALVGTGFGIPDLIAQITGLRNVAAGASAAVVNLQGAVSALDPAASSEVVNFNEYVNAAAPPSMFTKVNDIGSGFLKTQDGKLVWDGGSSGREFYLFNGGPLQTDLFETTFVLPSVPSHGWFGDDGANFMYLIGRSDAAGNNMVLARIAWDEVRIYSYNTGTFTELGSVARSDVVTGGCSVSFKGGTVANLRYFHVAVNGTTVLECTDTAPVSLYGANYRYCGLGVEKGGSYNTGTISTWGMMDGGASAGSGVVAGYTVAGLTNTGIWRGTRAQYDAITSKNPNWLYFVRG